MHHCSRRPLILIAALALITACASPESQTDLTIETLVTPEWLSQHLDDPDLVVLDCTVRVDMDEGGGFRIVSGRADYEGGHIPSAGFADLTGDLSDADSPLQFAVPTPEQFSAALGALGVGNDSRVVLYDRSGSAWAARVWWMLRWVGFDRAALLDGGLDAWIAEGRPLSTEPARRPSKQLTPAPRPELIADRDEVRRRRQTAWRRWGVGKALTAGDALFALANLAMTEMPDVPADIVCQVTRDLNQAALLVCEGQESDLSYEGRRDISVDDYLAMIERKTSALFAAAAAIGAQIAGAPPNAREALRAFGRHLGLGYQIADDVLGIWGDPEEMGKPVGSDLRRNKRSLPIVHALAAAAGTGNADLAGRLARGAPTNEEAAEVAAQMAEFGSRAFCERMAQESLERALDALDGADLRRKPAADLRTLATYLMERTE